MKISSRLVTLLASFALALPGLTLRAADASARKPNIVFILADDLGIGNVSCYGADNFKTPKIDALAQSGVRFTHCYASPLCGPSRALLMTGRYAYRTGMTGNDSGPLLTPAKESMMPKVLKPAGYVTAMCGKWGQLPLQPSDWGFDEYLRFNGSGKYWNTQANNQAYTMNGKRTPLRDGEYLPDTMHTFVVDFITRHKEQPFYVYYALSHVHNEILRTPDSAPDSKDLYYDNVAYMDKLVGKLVTELERLKLRESTLIVFAGDNGTVPRETPRSTVHGKVLSGSKGTMLECGALVPCLASWPGTIPAGKVSPSLIDFSDFLPTLAEAAGSKLPVSLTIDGKGFAHQLRGQSDVWPRDWIFVELGRHWYDREASWKLNEAAELFDMSGAPFEEKLVTAATTDTAAIAARKRLQAVLDQLNPAGGIVDPGDGSGRHAANVARAAKKKAGKGSGTPNSQNANAEDE
jgi:arylsulfatase A